MLAQGGIFNARYFLTSAVDAVDAVDGADGADARRPNKSSSRSPNCDPARDPPQGSGWIDASACSAYILKMLTLDAPFNAANARACTVSSASTASQSERHTGAREAAAALAVTLERRAA